MEYDAFLLCCSALHTFALFLELWWLEGHYHDRNKVTDSLSKCRSITQKLREGIHNESIVASHVRQVGDVSLMFVHAGFRRDMISFMKKQYSIEGTAEELSEVTNTALRTAITSQAQVAYIQNVISINAC